MEVDNSVENAGFVKRVEATILSQTLDGGSLTHLHDVELYGGAISFRVPRDFDDVSNLRPVPDHQEVYVQRNGINSIIVELLDDQHFDKSDLR